MELFSLSLEEYITQYTIYSLKLTFHIKNRLNIIILHNLKTWKEIKKTENEIDRDEGFINDFSNEEYKKDIYSLLEDNEDTIHQKIKNRANASIDSQIKKLNPLSFSSTRKKKETGIKSINELNKIEYLIEMEMNSIANDFDLRKYRYNKEYMYNILTITDEYKKWEEYYTSQVFEMTKNIKQELDEYLSELKRIDRKVEQVRYNDNIRKYKTSDFEKEIYKRYDFIMEKYVMFRIEDLINKEEKCFYLLHNHYSNKCMNHINNKVLSLKTIYENFMMYSLKNKYGISDFLDKDNKRDSNI